jgi:chromosome segregation ATPase
MSCCSKAKFVVGAAVVGIGVALAASTGVGTAMWHRAVAKLEKQIPPEVQIEQIKLDIDKLDGDIDRNWSPIATYEREIKELRADLDKKSAKIKSMEKELAAATDELDSKLANVKYEGRDYNRAEAGRVLNRELNYFVALKQEVVVKEKLLTAREQKLDAAMKNQKAMLTQKDELKTQVAQLEADLETLKLARTETKLPVAAVSRLDDIKERLNKLQTSISDEKRANQLRESFRHETSTDEVKDKVDTSDSVVSRARSVLGNSKLAKDE